MACYVPKCVVQIHVITAKLSGIWGPFDNETACHEFANRHGLQPQEYSAILLGNPESADEGLTGRIPVLQEDREVLAPIYAKYGMEINHPRVT
jgi:hypothetical protein